MAARAEDWYKQARHDLHHARQASSSGDFEWACFAAQQAAEKALKAVYQRSGVEAWGHSVLALLKELPAPSVADADLIEIGKELDRHYIPARYPNSYPQGAPYEYYTKADAERAVDQSERILQFCEGFLSR